MIKIEPWNIISSGTGPDWTTGTLSTMPFTWVDSSSFDPDNDIGHVLAGKKYDGTVGSGNKGQIIVSGDVATTYNVVSYIGFNTTTMTWDIEINETPLPSGKGTGGTNQFTIDFKVDSANITQQKNQPT